MQTSANGPDQENPIVKWFKDWISRTPFVSRTTLIFLGILQIGELLMQVNVAAKIANIPLYTVFHFEVYRLILSPFALGGLLDFLFTCIVISSLGPRLENAIGSTSFLSMIFILSTTTNLLFDLFTIVLAMNPIRPMPLLLEMPCFGFWLVVYGLLVHDCLQTPGTTRRLWLLPFNIPSEYYPWGLLAFFSLIFGMQLSSFVAVGAGYIYGYGYLNFAVPSKNRMQAWEQGWLRGIASNTGYVGVAASQGYNVVLPTTAPRNSTTTPSHGNSGTVIRQGNKRETNTHSETNATNTIVLPGERTLGSATGQNKVTDRKSLRDVTAAAAEARIQPPAAGIAGQSLKVSKTDSFKDIDTV